MWSRVAGMLTATRAAPATRKAMTGADDDRPQPAALRSVTSQERDPEPVDVVAEDSERGRQERQRADDSDQDHRDRADGHRPEEVVIEQEEPADREHHRQAGEEHRPAGRRRGDSDGLLLYAARAPLSPVAGDHEQ
jgi:hypothetical protein